MNCSGYLGQRLTSLEESVAIDQEGSSSGPRSVRGLPGLANWILVLMEAPVRTPPTPVRKKQQAWIYCTRSCESCSRPRSASCSISRTMTSAGRSSLSKPTPVPAARHVSSAHGEAGRKEATHPPKSRASPSPRLRSSASPHTSSSAPRLPPPPPPR